jgi:hypothetical protein
VCAIRPLQRIQREMQLPCGLRRRQLLRASCVPPSPSFPPSPAASGFLAYHRASVCGSLARGPDRRPVRQGKSCECDEGWTGINCNVCTSDRACDALMTETGDGGVCYTGGEVVKQNYQMCDVTNKAIRDILGAQVPQVTFTCNKESGECDFQCEPRTAPLPVSPADGSQSGLMNESRSCAT